MYFLQKKIWNRCPLVIFPAFISIIYYWSLAGAWFFCFDRITGLGKAVGMQYHYLLIKMFPVELDADYLLSLCLIAAFIIFLQFLILSTIRFLPTHQLVLKFNYALPDYIYAISALFFLSVSLFLVNDVLVYSLILDESVYLNIRSANIPYYSIHQLACWAMMLCVTIPLSWSLMNKINENGNYNLSIIYWISFFVCNGYLVFIGSRHETFLCGFIVLLMLGNNIKTALKHRVLLLIILIVWIAILALNDPFRSLTPIVSRKIGLTYLISTPDKKTEAEWYRVDRSFIEHHNVGLSKQALAEELNRDTILVSGTDTFRIRKHDLTNYWKEGVDKIVINNDTLIISNPHVSEAYYQLSIKEKILKALSGIIYSNEMFTGHFSLYGVLHEHIPVQTAISFKYLLYSFVPKFMGEDRPLSSYEYYAHRLNFPETQGFTINHITAWYLNFSYLGILLGPIALILFLFAPLLLVYYTKSEMNKQIGMFVVSCIVAFAAMIIRSGPESYKTWLYEGILMPYIILLSGFIFQKLFQLLKTKFINKEL
jgi:hypothetical protein